MNSVSHTIEPVRNLHGPVAMALLKGSRIGLLFDEANVIEFAVRLRREEEWAVAGRQRRPKGRQVTHLPSRLSLEV